MKVLYTGSFNPWHKGHQYVLTAARSYFGWSNVWVGIGSNSAKKQTKSPELLAWSLAPVSGNVVNYYGLTAEFCKKEHFNLIVRGIRPGRSLEYEEEMMYWNEKLSGVGTIFIPTPPEINQISSTVVRELHGYGHDVKDLVIPDVFERWKLSQIPGKEIYFGPTCCGKSTLIKAVDHNANDDEGWLDCDRKIWDFIPKKFRAKIAKAMEKAFYGRDGHKYMSLVEEIGETIDWRQFFGIWNLIDAPVLGTYFKYIPKDLIAQYKLIKVTTDEYSRNAFISKRGVSQHFLDCCSFFYCDPPYWDEEVVTHFNGHPERKQRRD